MRRQDIVQRLGRLLLFAGVLAVLGGRGLVAQTTTGTIRGYVKDQNGAPLSGAQVQATNVATSVARSTTTGSDGSYVLPGLSPGTYDVIARHIGNSPARRRIVVQIGATLLADFALPAGAVTLAPVVVQAANPAETRTSEVATNVTPLQIQQLPTPSRNFLDLAVLAPGVTVTEDRIGGVSRTFTAGGQPSTSVNIFVDGSSLKNDLTAGGVTGQDASKGNPFPRGAIQEYRVISQNFKAEYQKASSAVITATTRSGSNTWTGSVLYGYQNKSFVALDSFQRATPKFSKPAYSRSLLSASVGGPIQHNRLFFFGAYEGNYQNRSNLVDFGAIPAGYPALTAVNFPQYNGNFGSPFRETMLFGKVTYAASSTSSAEVSFSNRHETDVRDFGKVNCPGFVCAFTEAVNYRQNVSIGQVRYNMFKGPWLNETKVDYSRFRRNPSPNTPGLPAQIYQWNNQDHVIGSNFSTQDFIQRRVGIRNDLTYTGFRAHGEHVIKVGASFDFVTYDVFKGNDETPRFYYRDTVTTRGLYGYATPYQLIYGTGNAKLKKNNNEFGWYAQDDWSPSPQLTINLGIRWDFESNMFNASYVTPQMVIDTLTRYNDSLPTPLDLSQFISTGSNRKPFYGAFQPRLGFSYALDPESRTTIFGGWGLYYDRSIFDISVDETLKLTHPTYTVSFADPDSTAKPGETTWNNSYFTADKTTLDALAHTSGKPEAWLIGKNVKVPRSRQWNLGVRRVMGGGDYTLTATLSAVRGENQLTLNWANFGLKPDGSCCVSFDLGPHGFSNFIYSANNAKTWYDALQVQVDRPYRRSADNIGWGGGISLTYATRSLQGVDGLGDVFAFPNALNIPHHPANDEKTHIVANWVMDVPYASGFLFSGLITLGSGFLQDVGCPLRFCGAGYERGGFTPERVGFIIPNAFAYRNVDLRLAKDFPNISGTTMRVTLDLFNAFNYQNLGCFDTGSKTNLSFGHASCVVSDPRRLQVGAEYTF